MISEPEALGLLKKYGLSAKRIAHSQGVADVAFRIAKAIAARHPEHNVNPTRVRLAALFHDIGRAWEGDHVENSMAILRREMLDDLALLVTHGSAYEEAKLRGVDNPGLLPASLENRIVAYADTRFRLSLVSIEERIEEIRARRAKEPDKIKAVEMAKQQYLALEQELTALAGTVV